MLRFCVTLLIVVCLQCLRAERLYFDSFNSQTDTVIRVKRPAGILSDAFEIRASQPDADNYGKNPSYYGFRWNTTGGDSIVELRFHQTIEGEGSVIERHTGIVEASVSAGDDRRELFRKTIKDNISTGKLSNSLAIEITDGKEANVTFGKDELDIVGTIPAELLPCDTIMFLSEGRIAVEDMVYEYNSDPANYLKTDWSEQSLKDRFITTTNACEGFWQFLDRVTDDEYTRLGGDYYLATVANCKGGFDIIYISGAKTLRKQWHEGMIKGRLLPTIFKNHYNLEWYDAKMERYDIECHAQFSDDAILTLSFPLLKSTLRMSKVPSEMYRPKDR